MPAEVKWLENVSATLCKEERSQDSSHGNCMVQGGLWLYMDCKEFVVVGFRM